MTARLRALDAFRGLAIGAMLVVNNPGDWSHLYAPLAHARWDGWTVTDWVFPFFVFISGLSMRLSLGRRAAAGPPRAALLRHALRRGAVLVLIGLALNALPALDWTQLRVPGVLQRLGLCAMLCAPLVLYLGWRGQLTWCAGLLITYTLAQTWIPVPDAQGIWHTGSWSPGQDVGAWLDRWLMSGHLWRQSQTWDPEGLLSTLPALASQLAGVLAGHWMARRMDAAHKTIGLLLVGLLLLWAAQVLGAWSMPINKNLWSPAFVLLTSGFACLVLGSCYWLLDALPDPRWRARLNVWAQPLVVLGMNALFLFVLSSLIAKLLLTVPWSVGLSLKGALVQALQGLGLAPVNTSLTFALLFTAAMYAVAWGLWRRRWFIKIG